MQFLRRMKDWLSCVRKTSWHYQLVKDWGRMRNKTCAYYWMSVPGALVRLMAVLIVGFIATVLGWFLGFTADFEGSSRSGFLGYKTDKKGNRRLFAPWEIASFILLAYGVVRAWPFFLQAAHLGRLYGIYVLAGAGGAVALYGILRLVFFPAVFGSIRFAVGLRARKFYEKACPDLIVED